MAKKDDIKTVKPSSLISADQFKEYDAPEFGGEINVLKLDVGEGVIVTYAGHKPIKTSLGETTSHTGIDDDGKVWALPLAKIFKSNFEMANPLIGDKFAILRLDDASPKSGIAKGKELMNFTIKKLSTAAVEA